MKKERLYQLVELLFSVVIVVGIYWIGANLRLTEKTIPVQAPVIEHRDQFYSGVIVGDSVRWVVGKKGKILRSNDRGLSWLLQKSGVNSSLQSIAAWDSLRAVIVGNNGLVLVTGDGGKNWKKIQLPGLVQNIKLLRVRIDPRGVAWLVGAMGTVYASDDAGEAWHRMAVERDQAWNDIGFPSAGKVWLVGEYGHVAVTEYKDALGKVAPNWLDVKVPAEHSLMAITFRDAQIGVIAGLDGVLLRTEDAGKRWERIPLSTTEHIFDVAFGVDSAVGVGTRGLHIKSDRSGVRWLVGRVSNEDYAWHTSVAIKGDEELISGETLGQMFHGDWKIAGRKSSDHTVDQGQ